MSERKQIVTIDGPAGVGKSTISRKVAAALDFTYLDTGAMYRGVAYYLRQLAIDCRDESAVAAALVDLRLTLLPGKREGDEVGVIICGEDISAHIRTPQMSMAASTVSKLMGVRKKLTAMQQEIGERERIVAEGRDTGTVVFPLARYKFFLDAAPEERARRRILQLRASGQEVDEDSILALTIERDRNDRQRAIAPLRQAADAVLIDTTHLQIDEVCRRVLTSIADLQAEERGR
ncbi:MAG: (d)CMP kinase [Desulfopila sp.]